MMKHTKCILKIGVLIPILSIMMISIANADVNKAMEVHVRCGKYFCYQHTITFKYPTAYEINQKITGSITPNNNPEANCKSPNSTDKKAVLMVKIILPTLVYKTSSPGKNIKFTALSPRPYTVDKGISNLIGQKNISGSSPFQASTITTPPKFDIKGNYIEATKIFSSFRYPVPEPGHEQLCTPLSSTYTGKISLEEYCAGLSSAFISDTAFPTKCTGNTCTFWCER